MDDSFVIDTSPGDQRNSNIPQYRVERKSLELINAEKTVPQKFRNYQLNTSTCWNCGKKNHSIRECKAEYNQYTVEWNKGLQILSKEYEGKKRNGGRYHEKEKFSEDFTRGKPGVMSARLRQVLGLKDNELPPYIYRLRAHGYPKAWLKYTSVKPSGINLYDAHGNEVADPDAEDGEIFEEEDRIKYDLGKLIQFPGFNVPMPENCVDEYRKMKCPPFSEEQSLENMIVGLKEKAITEYCLRKNDSSSNAVIDSSQETVDDDMDVDCSVSAVEDNTSIENSFIPPLPNETVNVPLPPDDGASICIQPESESISDLHEKSVSSIDSEGDKTPSASGQNGLGRILSSAEGTPLLKSKSGHTRLPPPENFSKDICDVINFENLPESTGKFEKMRDLLKKVKKVLDIQRQNF